MPTLKNRVAIVTGGAGQGIGRSIALRLAKDGATVVVTDITGKENETLNEIRNLGGQGMALRLDVTDPRMAEDVAKRSMTRMDASTF